MNVGIGRLYMNIGSLQHVDRIKEDHSESGVRSPAIAMASNLHMMSNRGHLTTQFLNCNNENRTQPNRFCTIFRCEKMLNMNHIDVKQDEVQKQPQICCRLMGFRCGNLLQIKTLLLYQEIQDTPKEFPWKTCERLLTNISCERCTGTLAIRSVAGAREQRVVYQSIELCAREETCGLSLTARLFYAKSLVWYI